MLVIQNLLREIGPEPISGVWLRDRLREAQAEVEAWARDRDRLGDRLAIAEARALAAEREVEHLREALVDLRDAHERMRWSAP